MSVVRVAVEFLVSSVAGERPPLINIAVPCGSDPIVDADADATTVAPAADSEDEELGTAEETEEATDAMVRDTVEFLVERCVDMGVLPCPQEGERGSLEVDDGREKAGQTTQEEAPPPVISMPQQPEEQWAQEEAPLVRLGGPDIPGSFTTSQGGSAPSSGSPSRSGSRPGSGARHRRRVVNRSRANSMDGTKSEAD